MTTIDQYTRHAQRYGTEGIFETALEDADLAIDYEHGDTRSRTLARLVHRLRRLDKRFKLDNATNRALVRGMVRDKFSIRDITYLVGVSRPVVKSEQQALNH